MVKKKLLSVALVAVTVCSMIFTGCGSSAENTGNDTGKTDSDAQAGNTAGDVADVADDVEKPEKITIMVDGTFQATLADGQEEWVNKWKADSPHGHHYTAGSETASLFPDAHW